MKKRIILVLTVLMLAAPAGATVYITCTVDGFDVTVHYDANTEPNLVRGFALDIEVSSGTITDFTVDSFFNIYYNIYPGSIDINNTTGLVDSNGSPICDPCVYPIGTLPGLNSAGMTVEFGSLYKKGVETPPDPCGDMFTFTVSGAGCNVTIVENQVRGGVVMETPSLAGPDVCSPGIFVDCTVPNVVGEPNDDAQAAIIAASFTVGTITDAYDDVVTADVVISQSPSGGATPGCGTPVGIHVSLGPCVVPDVTGMSPAAADTALLAAGFTIGASFTNENSTQTVGTIAATYPAAGATPGCGTDVNTYVSAGECMSPNHPDYSDWVGAAFGWDRPDCWCNDRQQRGNSDQQLQGPFPVGSWDLDNFRLAFNVHVNGYAANPEYICCDFDHAFQGPFPTGSYDLNVFRHYFNDHINSFAPTSGPGCQDIYLGVLPENDPNHLTDPASWRPCDSNALSNSEYIFWDVKGGD